MCHFFIWPFMIDKAVGVEPSVAYFGRGKSRFHITWFVMCAPFGFSCKDQSIQSFFIRHLAQSPFSLHKWVAAKRETSQLLQKQLCFVLRLTFIDLLHFSQPYELFWDCLLWSSEWHVWYKCFSNECSHDDIFMFKITNNFLWWEKRNWCNKVKQHQ